MKQVKTAKGRVIDMASLAKTNETTRAVSPGNEKMNGRGDRIDSSGNVLQTVKAKALPQKCGTSVTCQPHQPKKPVIKKQTC
jgi:hypothetical protein